ncbi:GPW/gp25 family protein [Candidatus Bathyarchaeota archaeon]|nr:GPW/gp25 family protein [Candidatus Bathyarchaeota archaeon]
MLSEKDAILGRDLRLRFEETGADLSVGPEGDLELVSGELNLAQAIIHRLTTGEGELYDIGHADYGSRLHELLGEPNNERTRARAKNIVLNCLAQEPRIREVISVNVRTNSLEPHRLDIEITVLPIASPTTLSIVYPFSLEVG